MKRDSFIFYRSFMEALDGLNDTQYARVFRAISKYALDYKELRLTGVEKVIFQLVKPQLDANRKRYENGCRGGRPTETKPNDNQTETKAQPNENDNVNVNVNNLKEEENREEEKSSSSPLEFLNEEISSFVRENNIVVDGYNGNIQALDFGKIRKAFKESAWLRQNISSLKKVCEIYPKIESGYYKDYVGVGEIVIPQEEWFKVEKVLLEMKQNSTDFNPNYESYKDYKAKQEHLYATLSEDVRAYYGDYGGFVSLFEYKSLENEKARFIRDFERFCQKRRMKNA